MAMTARSDPLGVVGLGRLGLPIARRLLAAGYPVRGCDVSEDACAGAAAAGIAIDDSPRQLASATHASLVLVGDDEEVRNSCVDGEDALLAGMDPGHTTLICATVLPTTVVEVAEAVRARGGDVLDAPLARGEQAVERGKALALCGGRRAPFDRWRPALAEFCTDVVHLGDVGAGQVGKMVNNLLLWSTIAANYEGLRLAQRFGVDLDALREGLLLGSGRNWALETWERPRDMPWAGKDLEIVLRSSAEQEMPAPVSQAVQDAIAAIRSDKLAWQQGRSASMAEFLASTVGTSPRGAEVHP